MSSVAQNEISNLSSSITWGIRRLAQRGIIHKATDLYGYSIDKNRNWEVVPEEANVIRYIAKEFLNGKSFNEIIKDLHDKAIKSPSGKSYWHDGQIRGMLRNEKYMGDYLFQKRYTPEVIGSKIKKNNGEVAQYYIENHHPSIIDEKQWYLLQEEFKIRSKAPIENRKTPRTAGRGVFYNKYFCSNCGGTITRYRSQDREGREGGHWRCYNSYGTIKECYINCSIKQEYLELNFYETLRLIGSSEEFKEKVEKVIEKLSLTMEELKHKTKIKENIDDLNQHLYIAVDYELNEEGHDIKKIDYLTGEIINLQDQLKAYDERIDKVDYYKTELNELLKVCKAVEPISFREFHNMDARIKPGDSIYDTTKNAKDRTYIKEDKKDYFPEVIFEKYINKCQVDHEGRITYMFLFGVDFVIDMTNQVYLDTFEKTKAEINLEELLISKEAIELRKFCKEAKYPKEMRSHINISSNNSFRKRILKPLIQAGKLKLIRGTGTNDWSYYWNEEN